VACHQVLAKYIRLQLEFIHAVLDDVAETHDSAELAPLDHGEVTNAVAGHTGHDRPDALRWRTRDSRRGHQLGNRQCEEFRAVLGQTADDVALRDQAEHGDTVLAHHLGADALDFQTPDDRVEGRVGPRCLNVCALGLEDQCDAHGVLPGFRSLTVPYPRS